MPLFFQIKPDKQYLHKQIKVTATTKRKASTSETDKKTHPALEAGSTKGMYHTPLWITAQGRDDRP